MPPIFVRTDNKYTVDGVPMNEDYCTDVAHPLKHTRIKVLRFKD